MDFQSDVEKKNFLGIFGAPYKGLCNLMTLKSGVILIGTFDISFSIYFAYSMSLNLGRVRHEGEWEFMLIVFRILMSSIAFFFGFIGINGMKSINTAQIKLYSRFKIFEFITLLLCDFALSIIIFNFDIYHLHHDLFFFVFFFIFKVIAGVFAKTVWSANIRIEYNEKNLVLYGEDASKIIQQQSLELSHSRNIKPGMPVFMGTPNDA